MFHPSDPSSRTNMHISMKVDIIAEGPGGLQFSQSIQTIPYYNQTEGCVTILSPEFAQNPVEKLNIEPEHLRNMVTWPLDENYRSKVADQDMRKEFSASSGEASSSGKASNARTSDRKGHHHHHHHRDQKPCHHGPRHHHSHQNTRKRDRGRHIRSHDIELNASSSILSKTSDSSASIVKSSSTNRDRVKPRYSGPAKTPYHRPYDYNLNSRLHDTGLTKIYDLRKEPRMTVMAPDNSNYREVRAISSRQPSLYQKQIKHLDDRIVTNESSLIQEFLVAKRVDDLNNFGTSVPNNSNLREPLSPDQGRPSNASDMIMALMDPIIKLSEHLAVTEEALVDPKNLGVDEESNLEIKSMVTAWQKKMENAKFGPNLKIEPTCQILNRDAKDKESLNRFRQKDVYIPYETLINDAGVESKEIQTSNNLFYELKSKTNDFKDISSKNSEITQDTKEAGPSKSSSSACSNLDSFIIGKMLKHASRASDGPQNPQNQKADPYVANSGKLRLLHTNSERKSPTLTTPSQFQGDTNTKDIEETKLKYSNPSSLKAGSSVKVRPSFATDRKSALLPKSENRNQEPGFVEQAPEQQSAKNQILNDDLGQNRFSSGSLFKLLTKDPGQYKFGLQSCAEDSENIIRPIPQPRNFGNSACYKRDLYTLVEVPESPLSSRSAKTTSARSSLASDNKNAVDIVPGADKEDNEDGSPKSINSETSSLSGANRSGAFKISELNNCTDENFIDYFQETLSVNEGTIEDDDNTIASEGEESLASENSLVIEKMDDYANSYDANLKVSLYADADDENCQNMRSFGDILKCAQIRSENRNLYDSKNGKYTGFSPVHRSQSPDVDAEYNGTASSSIVDITPQRTSSFTKCAELIVRNRVEDQAFLHYVGDEDDPTARGGSIPIRVDWKLPRGETAHPEKPPNHTTKRLFKQTDL